MTGGESESSVRPRRHLNVDEGRVSVVKRRMLFQMKITDEQEAHFEYLTEEERTIGTAPNVEAFQRWAANEKRVICDYIRGKIIVREIPTTPHGCAQSNISFQFRAQGGGLKVGTASDLLSRTTGDILAPDVVVHARGVSTVPGGSLNQVMYPVLVVEIACSQRPLDLHQRAARFLGAEMPSVEYYIGIQRYDVRTRSDALQGLLCAVYTRATPTIPVNLISFGTGGLHFNSWWDRNAGVNNFPNIVGVGYGGPPCDAPGIPLYTLQFPAVNVFNTRAGGVPNGVPGVFTLDLFQLQDDLQLEFAEA